MLDYVHAKQVRIWNVETQTYDPCNRGCKIVAFHSVSFQDDIVPVAIVAYDNNGELGQLNLQDLRIIQ